MTASSLVLFLLILVTLVLLFDSVSASLQQPQSAAFQETMMSGRADRSPKSSNDGTIATTAALSGGALDTKKSLRYAATDNTSLPLISKERDMAYLWSSLFAGVGSGALASVFCAPLDLIRTRMQVWGDLHVGQHAPIRTILSDVLKKEGWKGCFRGLGATLATVPMFWGLYFPLYDELKRKWGSSQYGNTHPSLIHCGSAIGAGCVADAVCNPMFVIRTRMQTEALHQLNNGGPNKYNPHGIFQTAVMLYKEGSWPIFWRGMTANLMGLSHVAIQFPVYEWLKQEARARSKTGHESAFDLLLASGLSKACASLITYPHEVIRSRMMDSRGLQGTVTLVDTSRRIFAKEGLAGFYTGLHVSLVRVLPNCCITFMTYELLLRFARRQIKSRQES